MANVVIVGAQWGDEGKGKVVDLYTEFADVVVRYGGGANAGHTLVVDGQKLVTHLIPSGVLRGRGKRCVLGDGMVIDPEALLEEIAELQGARACSATIATSSSASARTSSCRCTARSTRVREQGKGAIGTTKRGIGPAYEAKMARRGVRMGDLLDDERFRDARRAQRRRGRRHWLRASAASPSPSVDDGRRRVPGLRRASCARYVGDASRLVHDEIKRGRHVLFEGAQGALLDVDHGTYPFVTSSSTLAGGRLHRRGIGPTAITAVIGIAKAYTTRVGGGPFPTELHRRARRSRCARRAASSARPPAGRVAAAGSMWRRCGWRCAGTASSGLALTKLDVLRGMGGVKICVGYTRRRRRRATSCPPTRARSTAREPVYEELEGWDADTREVRDFDELPPAAQKYVRRIEELVGVDCALISVGPGRAETIVIRNPFR